MMPARKGRPRKRAVARYSSGRRKITPSWQREEEARAIVKDQRRRSGVPEDQLLDQRGESPLGRYAMRSWLDVRGEDGRLLVDGMVLREAGLQFARMAAAVKRDYGGKSDDPPSTFPTRLLPGTSARFDSEEHFTPDQQRQARGARLRRYNAAFEALQDAGKEAARLVNLVAVKEHMIDPHVIARDLPLLRCGLLALAKHFGLTRG